MVVILGLLGLVDDIVVFACDGKLSVDVDVILAACMLLSFLLLWLLGLIVSLVYLVLFCHWLVWLTDFVMLMCLVLGSLSDDGGHDVSCNDWMCQSCWL